ncbi:hypothetical protein [Gordonia sp. (in: high G+C Gram-positive bacteria)]|uniref:hypothetical protein n=1 Tax=Gordonia sp. (in: high G+C Gram-positive bacteria) TaxID=84139 RepID=UPI00333E3C3F
MTETEVQPEPLSGDNVEDNPGLEPENTEDVQPTDAPEEPDTFSREYVEKLRQENGRYRQRAQRADDLAHRLHRELVRSDGRLQDPTDLDFSDDHLADDGVSLTEAIDDLLTRKPHLATRRPIGDVGQGATTSSTDVNLLGILRGQ